MNEKVAQQYQYIGAILKTIEVQTIELIKFIS